MNPVWKFGKKLLDKIRASMYNNHQRSFGGSTMNDRIRSNSSLIINEAILASLIGLLIFTQPVVYRSLLKL